MRKIIIHTVMALMLSSIVYTQDSWNIIGSGLKGSGLSITFINNNTGFVCGGDVDATSRFIVKTTDGGNTWSNVFAEQTGGVLYSVYFVNDLVGFSAGWGGTILKTTNSGDNWFSIYDLDNSKFMSIKLTDSLTGFIAGYENVVMKTNDGGNNWERIDTKILADYSSLWLLNDKNIFICGSDGTLIKSSDGGNTWSKQILKKKIFLNSLYFSNEKYGYICGSSGYIIRTTDGGINWKTVVSGEENTALYSIYFLKNTQTGFTAGYYTFTEYDDYEGKDISYAMPMIMRTQDGGKEWEKIDIEERYYCFYDVFFVDTKIGYLTTQDGKILKSIKGGK